MAAQLLFDAHGESEIRERLALTLRLGAAVPVSRWEHLIAVLERVLGETFAGRA
jgi:hypothetical protein